MDKMYFITDLAIVVSGNKWDKIKNLYKGTELYIPMIVCPCKEDAKRFVEKKTLKLWKRKPENCRSGALFYALDEKCKLFWSNGMLDDACLYSDDFIPVQYE